MRTLEQVIASKPVAEVAKAGKHLTEAARKRNSAAFAAWYGSLAKDERKAWDRHDDAEKAAESAAFAATEKGQKFLNAFCADFDRAVEAAKPMTREERELEAEDMMDYSHHRL